ncbi:MAG: hypothetical protein NC043_05235 [Muribaculaceae bacterium]|nr:hypothetical protein [Muribaculaceae bacterium]
MNKAMYTYFPYSHIISGIKSVSKYPYMGDWHVFDTTATAAVTACTVAISELYY